MTESVGEIDVPFGWIVGPAELRIHLFRPYVVESRVKFLHRKTCAFVAGMKEHPEDIAVLQEDFREMVDMLNGNYLLLCGHELLGSGYRVSRVMDTFKQVAATSHAGVPPNFHSFWQSYLYPLVQAASNEELENMRAECSPPFWAAMIGETTGQSSAVVGEMVGAAAVRSWSLFGRTRAFKCARCQTMETTCADTGDAGDAKCRLCCIESAACDASADLGTVDLEDQQSLAYTIAGIERLRVQQKSMLGVLAELVQVQKDIVDLATHT